MLLFICLFDNHRFSVVNVCLNLLPIFIVVVLLYY